MLCRNGLLVEIVETSSFILVNIRYQPTIANQSSMVLLNNKGTKKMKKHLKAGRTTTKKDMMVAKVT